MAQIPRTSTTILGGAERHRERIRIPIMGHDLTQTIIKNVNLLPGLVHGINPKDTGLSPSPEMTSTAFSLVGLLPPDSRLLSPTFTRLQEIIKSNDSKTPLTAKLAAVVMFDAIFSQTVLEIPNKVVVGSVPDEDRLVLKETLTAVHNSPAIQRSPDAGELALETLKAAQLLLMDLHTHLHEDTSSRAIFDAQVTILDALAQTQDGTLFALHKIFGDQKISDIIRGFYQSTRQNVLTTPFARTALRDGELSGYHEDIRFRTIIHGIENIFDGEMPPGDGRDIIIDAFLADAALQKRYWKSFERDNDIITIDESDSGRGHINIPVFYPYIEPFLLRDERTITQFLENTHIETLTASEQMIVLKRLIGIAATFQLRHPEHQHAKHLRKEIANIAQRLDRQGEIRDYLAILRNDTPGSIYIQTDGNLRMRRNGIQPNDLYISKEVPAASVIPEPKRQIATVEPIAVFLPIEQGESVALPGWETLCQPAEQSMPELIDSLRTRFNNLVNTSGIDWTNRGNYLTTAIDQPHDTQTLLIPELLQEGHALSQLSAIGIAAIQRDGNNYTIVLDAQETGVDMNGQRYIALPAHFNNDIFQFNLTNIDSLGEFGYSDLHIALTEAALLLQHGETGKIATNDTKLQKRLDAIPEQIVGWKNRVSGVRKNATKSTIIIPLNSDNTVIRTRIG